MPSFGPRFINGHGQLDGLISNYTKFYLQGNSSANQYGSQFRTKANQILGLYRLRLQFINNIKMDKKIALLIMAVIIGIQAIHFGYAAKYYTYSNKIDDNTNTPRSRFDSATTKAIYPCSFYFIAAGFSVLAYAVGILTNLANISIHPKLVYHLNLLVFFMQFTLAVLFAVEISLLVAPNSSHAGATEKDSDYIDRYWLQLADTVITWVLCVPGSFALAFLNSKEGQGMPVEQKSITIA